MVHSVGGDRVAVTTIVGPNADTHVYEPKPADARRWRGADIFFVNGLGFEGWMDRLVECDRVQGAGGRGQRRRRARHTMDEDGKMVTDPHAWQSLKNGLLYVDNIARGLCQVDADGLRRAMRRMPTAYTAEIAALDAEVRGAIATVPEAKRKVITTHDAFGYFGEAYGVTFLAPGRHHHRERSLGGGRRRADRRRSGRKA